MNLQKAVESIKRYDRSQNSDDYKILSAMLPNTIEHIILDNPYGLTESELDTLINLGGPAISTGPPAFSPDHKRLMDTIYQSPDRVTRGVWSHAKWLLETWERQADGYTPSDRDWETAGGPVDIAGPPK